MLNVAIIGCGDMGSKHAAAWHARDDCRVSAVCDVDPARRQTLAQTFGASPYNDWRSTLQHRDIDVVSICTPANYHSTIAVAAARLGKQILCEKPMALSLDDAQAMMAAARDNGINLHISHQYRGLSRYRIIKKLIDDGLIGSPLFIRFMEMREVRPKLAMHSRKLSGGPIHDMSGHLFDLARFFVDAEPESVTAFGTIFGGNKKRLVSVDDLGIDTAEIQVRFAGGHFLTIGINWGLPEGTPSYSHETVYGPSGVAYTFDPVNKDLNLGEPSDTIQVKLKNAKGTRVIPCEADYDGPQVCVDHLMHAIGSSQSEKLDGLAGYNALQLIMAALDSIATGHKVQLR